MSKQVIQLYSQELQEYMKRALTPMYVLQLLSEKPMYAAQISKEIRMRSDDLYTTSCFPTVQRLLKENFIAEAGIVMSNNGSRRMSFDITDIGRELLKELTAKYYTNHNVTCKMTVSEEN